MSFDTEGLGFSDDNISYEVDSLAEETDLRKLGTDVNFRFKHRHISFYIFFVVLHFFSIQGLYYCFYDAKFATILWGTVLLRIISRTRFFNNAIVFLFQLPSLLY